MSAQHIEKDTFPTTFGPLDIFFLGHGSLMMELDGKTASMPGKPEMNRDKRR